MVAAPAGDETAGGAVAADHDVTGDAGADAAGMSEETIAAAEEVHQPQTVEQQHHDLTSLAEAAETHHVMVRHQFLISASVFHIHLKRDRIESNSC